MVRREWNGLFVLYIINGFIYNVFFVNLFATHTSIQHIQYFAVSLQQIQAYWLAMLQLIIECIIIMAFFAFFFL